MGKVPINKTLERYIREGEGMLENIGDVLYIRIVRKKKAEGIELLECLFKR